MGRSVFERNASVLFGAVFTVVVAGVYSVLGWAAVLEVAGQDRALNAIHELEATVHSEEGRYLGSDELPDKGFRLPEFEFGQEFSVATDTDGSCYVVAVTALGDTWVSTSRDHVGYRLAELPDGYYKWCVETLPTVATR